MSAAHSVVARRLVNQRITRPSLASAERAVEWFGAVQAQEYGPAKWGLGLRMRTGTVDADIERAFTDGRILRTHVLRPTWHFVAAPDIRWMAALSAPQVHRAMQRYRDLLAIDTRMLTRATAIFERALAGRFLTRADLNAELARAGIAVKGVRLAHLTMYAELEGVICSGPRRESTFTYALAAERAPGAKPLPRDESLATLAARYFQSHGPATLRDFMWWSGLKSADAKRAIEMIRARPLAIDGLTYWATGRAPAAPPIAGTAVLLPIYDEYVVAYRDRVAVPHAASTVPGPWGNATFQHALIVDGQIAGMWKLPKPGGTVRVTWLRAARPAERRAVTAAIGRYERFVE